MHIFMHKPGVLRHYATRYATRKYRILQAFSGIKNSPEATAPGDYLYNFFSSNRKPQRPQLLNKLVRLALSKNPDRSDLD